MQKNDPIWDVILEEARQASAEEPLMADFFYTNILAQPDLNTALSHNLAQQLASSAMSAADIAVVILQALQADDSIGRSVRLDMASGA